MQEHVDQYKITVDKYRQEAAALITNKEDMTRETDELIRKCDEREKELERTGRELQKIKEDKASTAGTETSATASTTGGKVKSKIGTFEEKMKLRHKDAASENQM